VLTDEDEAVIDVVDVVGELVEVEGSPPEAVGSMLVESLPVLVEL